MAASNAENVARDLRRQASQLEDRGRDLPEQREEEERLKKSIRKLRREAKEGAARAAELGKKVQGLQESVDRLQELDKEATGKRERISSLQSNARNIDRSTKKLGDRANPLEKRKKSKVAKWEKLQKATDPSSKDEGGLAADVNQLQEDVNSLGLKVGESGQGVTDVQTLIEEGRCPVCERDASVDEFGSRLKEREEAHGKLHFKWTKAKKDLERARNLLEAKRAYVEAVGKAHELEADITGIIEEQDGIAAEMEKLAAEKELHTTELGKLEDWLKNSDRKLRELSDVNGLLDRTRSEWRKAQKVHTEFEERLKNHQELLTKLREAIKTLEDPKEQAEGLRGIDSWLSEFFRPAVLQIEQEVMASINEDFNALFQRWFMTLLETGEIAVRVDEGFSPLVEERGYELPLNSLSGGERTSVAMAYRLAQSGIARPSARTYLLYIQIFYRLRAQTYQDSGILETYMRIRAIGSGRAGRSRGWKPLGPTLVRRLMEASEGEDYVFLMTLLYTGGRAQFHGLKVENLDLARGELTVEVKGSHDPSPSGACPRPGETSRLPRV